MSLSQIINLGGNAASASLGGGSNVSGSGSNDTVISINAPPVVAASAINYTWFMDKGSFFDRFGVAMLNVLMSTDPITMALVKNIQTRNWVDLQDTQVAAGLSYMSGTATPELGTISTPITGVTTELITTMLSTPPTPLEQYCTVKLYFS